MESKLVIITGAAGFLGSHLAEHYLGSGYRVIGIDNFATGSKANVSHLQNLASSENFHFVEADVCEASSGWVKDPLWRAQLKDLKYILHFASPASPPLYQKLALETMWVNSLALRHAIELADQHGSRVVFASTSEIYGDPEVAPQPESYWGNVNTVGVRSCYDEAKRFGESLIHTSNLVRGTKHGLVRIFNTYGPRMNINDGRVIINFLVQALKGEPLTVFGTGQQTRSFCYVEDLVAAISTYTDRELTRPVNIGNDREFTILEAAQAVQKLFPEKNLVIEHRELPSDDPKRRRPDLTLAKDVLSPWTPKVQFEEGLRYMLNWVRQESLT